MLKPTILELKVYPGWDPETDIDYTIKDNFPKYYNDKDRNKNFNKKAGRLAIYN